MQKGGIINERDFLECTMTLHRSFRRSVHDAAYRRATRSRTFHIWNRQHRLTTSSVPKFRVGQHVERQPVYRQSRMLELMSEQHCALHEARRPADIRICWSHYQALANPTTDVDFEQRPGGDGPSMIKVYDRLNGLSLPKPAVD